MKELEKLGCVEFTLGQEKLLISHFSPYEMADDMYKWAKENYLIGDVETLQFIAEGDHTTAKNSSFASTQSSTSSPKRSSSKWWTSWRSRTRQPAYKSATMSASSSYDPYPADLLTCPY